LLVMADQPPPRFRDPLPGRHRSGCNRKNLVHFGGSLPRSYMASYSPPRPCPPEPQVKKGGPLSRLAPLLCIGADSSQPLFLPFATARLRKGGPLSRLAAPLSMRAEFSSTLGLRLPLRGWLRLSLPLSLRGPVGPMARNRASQRHLRAFRFADIPTPLPIKTRPRRSKSCSPSISIPRPLHPTPALTPPRWFGNASPAPRRP
jgi:hypothetical protein